MEENGFEVMKIAVIDNLLKSALKRWLRVAFT